MNLNKACKILNLTYPFTQKNLKKAYYKAALKHHPDKKHTFESECDIQFHEVLDAYKFLNNYQNINDDIDDIDDNNSYEFILTNFINSLHGLNIDISKLILNIIINYKNITIKTFENIDKISALKILAFIEQYSTLFNINNITLTLIKDIFKTKFEISEDSLYILNPTIDNLFNADIYKLEHSNSIYYIPLWHDEITYDLSYSSIIIKCTPDLPDHIFIDNKNNINISIILSLENILDKHIIDINLGSKVFQINTFELRIQKKQLYILKNKGIPIIDNIDIYNISNKGDIIIQIEFY